MSERSIAKGREEHGKFSHALRWTEMWPNDHNELVNTLSPPSFPIRTEINTAISASEQEDIGPSDAAESNCGTPKTSSQNAQAELDRRSNK
ncbi:MAG: hypothetical protein HKN35_02570 [Woeseia sp.]|nr:hypothetical protein [Woeseia sp.]